MTLGTIERNAALLLSALLALAGLFQAPVAMAQGSNSGAYGAQPNGDYITPPQPNSPIPQANVAEIVDNASPGQKLMADYAGKSLSYASGAPARTYCDKWLFEKVALTANTFRIQNGCTRLYLQANIPPDASVQTGSVTLGGYSPTAVSAQHWILKNRSVGPNGPAWQFAPEQRPNSYLQYQPGNAALSFLFTPDSQQSWTMPGFRPLVNKRFTVGNYVFTDNIRVYLYLGGPKGYPVGIANVDNQQALTAIPTENIPASTIAGFITPLTIEIVDPVQHTIKLWSGGAYIGRYAYWSGLTGYPETVNRLSMFIRHPGAATVYQVEDVGNGSIYLKEQGGDYISRICCLPGDGRFPGHNLLVSNHNNPDGREPFALVAAGP